MRFRSRLAAVAGLAVLAAAGCDGNGRQPVSGTVTLKGKPVATGDIRFVPVDPKGIDGGAVITDGKFEIDGRVGLLPGKYKVRLSAPDRSLAGTGDIMKDMASPPTAREVFPKAYTDHVQSPLTVEVTAGGDNHLTIDIN